MNTDGGASTHGDVRQDRWLEIRRFDRNAGIPKRFKQGCIDVFVSKHGRWRRLADQTIHDSRISEDSPWIVNRSTDHLRAPNGPTFRGGAHDDHAGLRRQTGSRPGRNERRRNRDDHGRRDFRDGLPRWKFEDR